VEAINLQWLQTLSSYVSKPKMNSGKLIKNREKKRQRAKSKSRHGVSGNIIWGILVEVRLVVPRTRLYV
jgi:hypothetical protein